MAHRLSWWRWLIGRSRCTCGRGWPCREPYRDLIRDVDVELSMIERQRQQLRELLGAVEPW